MLTRNQSKKELFKILANFNKETFTSRIVNVDEFVNEYSSLRFKNGFSWGRKESWKNEKVAIYKNNGKISTFWNASDNEIKMLNDTFSKYKISNKGNDIKYIGIFGKKENNLNRPIRKDIKDFYKKIPCVVCGSKSDLVCDHKNDLYNDKRVLNTKTQKLNDFQSLCNHCNLQKRQINKKTRETGKRYGATNIPMLKHFGIDFISGNDLYNPNDINAMVGTFWYDPVEFMKFIIKK